MQAVPFVIVPRPSVHEMTRGADIDAMTVAATPALFEPKASISPSFCDAVVVHMEIDKFTVAAITADKSVVLPVSDLHVLKAEMVRTPHLHGGWPILTPININALHDHI
jgi:hypothetical protein